MSPFFFRIGITFATQKDVERIKSVPPIDDLEVNNSFQDAIGNMYNEESAKNLKTIYSVYGSSWPLQQARCSSKSHRFRPRWPNWLVKDARNEAPKLKHLVICFL